MRILPSLALLATALAAPVAQAQEASRLGRMFTTPEQREVLDRRRQLNIKEAEVVEERGSTTVNGRVVRSSGKSTTWLNGVPENDSYKNREADRVAVEGTDPQSRVPIKVGQTLDRTQGDISDGLNGGQVRIGRAAAQGTR
jgi:hypothetical protein